MTTTIKLIYTHPKMRSYSVPSVLDHVIRSVQFKMTAGQKPRQTF